VRIRSSFPARALAALTVLAALAALAALAGCGARFDDESAGDGLGAGTRGVPAPTTASAPEVPAGPGPAPGVSDTEIKIGYLLPLTGAAPVPSRFDKGVNAYWDYVNARGGIAGRKVRAIVEDTESQAEVGKDKAKKLIEDDRVFAIVVLDRLENQEAIGRYLNSRRVPTISIQTQANLPADQIWNFNVTIDQGLQGKIIADYMVKVLKLKRVGVVYENTPPLKAGVQQFTAEARRLGASVVISRTIEGQASDFLNEALALSQSRAQSVWLYMAPLPAAKIANQSLDAGFHPIWFANSISWQFDLALAVGPKSLEGARAFSPWLPLSDPRTKTYQDAYRRQNGEEPDDLGILGWGIGQIVAKGLENARPTLGQNSFREAMQHLRFRPDIWVPISFGPGVREGANQVAVLKAVGGHWVVERGFTAGF
jgi:branched-chain amino acid transport system substrate-binding protein